MPRRSLHGLAGFPGNRCSQSRHHRAPRRPGRSSGPVHVGHQGAEVLPHRRAAGAPPGTLRGESTPFYLYDRDAQRRIGDLIPQVKMIVILRDPVERAHSNWAHLWSAGLEPVGDFARACAEEDTRVAAGWAPFWHYTRLGRYAEQLEHLFLRFPREQVCILRYRVLLDTPAAALDDICGFLGVRQGIVARVP